MCRQFTSGARAVVVLAHQEASALRHDCIGCEHLLLGLIGEHNGLAARVFASLDVDVERVRAQVLQTTSCGSQDAAEIQFTPHAKQALELAVREARSLSHYWVGSEHMLLGLLRDDEVLSRSLSLLQIDAQRLAHAARAARPRRARFTLTHQPILVDYAKTIIERQAAIEGGDYARARKLHHTSQWLALIGPRPSAELAQDVILQRLCALVS